ncbi:hypothetical protein BO94DRAFT_144889 [Aspergillus sclerotioniger CBS 115572]|uniref:Uncharacterized protein n=1 Tax=Aspergillus sclerotioniger CBS 115572 TaxID=1450535 RepID=A0A317W4L8_9EURO|nr:hypothetical protein BO94DRAFT_144889 [Aspergillus sclerotioniger CBS 115572]PWY81524.1 hypothetical protein BO94DRAFT_144889 [Aspergillus sclerotioniger CBS 115572]
MPPRPVDAPISQFTGLGIMLPRQKSGPPQYLALRALWKCNKRTLFQPSDWRIQGVAKARKSLKGLAHWEKFLHAVPLVFSEADILPVTSDLGDLKLIWYYGQLIRSAPAQDRPDNEDNVRFTPISKRTKFQEKQVAKQGSVLDTPTPLPKEIAITNLLGHFSLDENPTSDPKETPSTDFYPDSPEDDLRRDPTYEDGSDDFPPVSDENLVNTYLLGLASLVTMSSEGVQAHWSQQRKAYKVRSKGAKLYEARTDGHLFLTEGKQTKAIVEVKAMARDDLPTVRMQETAEIAAWIHECPDEILKDTPKDKVFRRLLFSENRHEIYLIIAEYSANYVDQLTNPNHASKSKSFLTMNEYGPWDIGVRDDVEDIASVMLAVTLQFSKGLPLI